MATIERAELKLGSDGKWYYHRRAGNGRITDPSQGYASQAGARRAAKRDLPGLPVVVVR